MSSIDKIAYTIGNMGKIALNISNKGKIVYMYL
jgi:hypothetical protein